MNSKPPRRNPPPTSPSPANPQAPASAKGERLQKLLAAAGLGSRRAIEGWISAGRVSVDGRVAVLGERALPGAAITVDGRPVAAQSAQTARSAPRLLIYHKPVGEVVTRSDPGGRPTVFEKLPALDSGRWVSIGRLDLNSAGLLLFTDSGELANQLMHPRQEIEREYEVRVHGGLGPDAIRQLLAGVQLDDGVAKFMRLEARPARKDAPGSNIWYRAVLIEGRNREVRRMVEAVGGTVSRLVRIRFGTVRLPPELAAGRCIEADPGTVRTLVEATRDRQR